MYVLCSLVDMLLLSLSVLSSVVCCSSDELSHPHKPVTSMSMVQPGTSAGSAKHSPVWRCWVGCHQVDDPLAPPGGDQLVVRIPDLTSTAAADCRVFSPTILSSLKTAAPVVTGHLLGSL